MLGLAITAASVTRQIGPSVIPSWNVFPERVVGAQCFAVRGYFLAIVVDNAVALYVRPAPVI